MDWITGHLVEIAGVLFSLLYLWLSIKRNILLWPVGMISALLYIIVFYHTAFYADMSLNIYYFFISIYGWINWTGKSEDPKQQLKVTRASGKLLMLILSVAAGLFFLGGQILDRYTDSPLPYWDAFTTALSIVATWMLTRKIIEHWLLWIVIDTVSFGLYIYRELYPTALLFVVYTIMAIIGYIEWKKTIGTEKQRA